MAIESFGRPDLVVHNAGVGIMPTPVQKIAAADWDRTINATLRGTLLAMQSQVAFFRAQRYGAIANIAPLAAISGTPYLTPMVQ